MSDYEDEVLESQVDDDFDDDDWSDDAEEM